MAGERALDPVDHLEVRRLVKALRTDPEGPLQELARVLPAHFQYEERPGGFFDRMIELDRSLEAVARLKEDHQDILAEVTLLLEAERDAAWSERIEKLAHHLERHEFEESRFAAQNPLLSAEHDAARGWGF